MSKTDPLQTAYADLRDYPDNALARLALAQHSYNARLSADRLGYIGDHEYNNLTYQERHNALASRLHAAAELLQSARNAYEAAIIEARTDNWTWPKITKTLNETSHSPQTHKEDEKTIARKGKKMVESWQQRLLTDPESILGNSTRNVIDMLRSAYSNSPDAKHPAHNLPTHNISDTQHELAWRHDAIINARRSGTYSTYELAVMEDDYNERKNDLLDMINEEVYRDRDEMYADCPVCHGLTYNGYVPEHEIENFEKGSCRCESDMFDLPRHT